MTFGTLLSSQGTDASFGPVSPGPSGRFPSFTSLSCCLAFPTLSDAFQCPIPAEAGFCYSLSGVLRFRVFPFPASPTLSDPFGPDSQSAGLVLPAVGPFRRVRL
ncbi:hypothetical protein DDE05_35600 [Streptomyces cavourensis]|nr:hypothetical protein DDE05_35600 [Streptomyces cavourensis]